MDTQLYSLGDVAEMLNVQAHRIAYLMSTRTVPKPMLRIGGRHIWSLPEIEVLAERLSVPLPPDLYERTNHD